MYQAMEKDKSAGHAYFYIFSYLHGLQAGFADDLDSEVVPPVESGSLARRDLVRGGEGSLAQELRDLVFIVELPLEPKVDLAWIDLYLLSPVIRQVLGEDI